MHVFNRKGKKTERNEPAEEESDEHLVALLIGGDFGAYGRLIRRHQFLVNRLAFALTKDRKRAGELAMAALISLWTERGKVKADIPLNRYLLELVIRLHKREPPYLSDN
jgi:DNA-directed RNA polymerase specialized sigma24 family protein